MKVIKFRQSLLNKSCDDIMRFANAVDELKKQAYPEFVYMSKTDYKTLRKNLTKKYGKLFTEMHLLNLGPNQSLENAVKDGYLIVDEESIKAMNMLE